VFNNNGVVSVTGNRIGFGGFAIDTERDNSIPPSQVITVTGGTGRVTIGPYNIQPAWGCGFQFRLLPGQSLSLLGDHTKVVGDGSTKRLYLDVDRVSPNNTDINWSLTH
jgi:hypothetical protein